MLSLEELRKIDPTLSDLSDAELIKVRNDLYKLGQIVFDDWASEDRSGSKFPVKVIYSLSGKVSI